MCPSCTRGSHQFIPGTFPSYFDCTLLHTCLLHTKQTPTGPCSSPYPFECTLLSCVSLAYKAVIARSCHVCLLHTGLSLHTPVMCVSCIQGWHCTLLSCVSLAYRAGSNRSRPLVAFNPKKGMQPPLQPSARPLAPAPGGGYAASSAR